MVRPWADGPFQLIIPPKGELLKKYSPDIVGVATTMCLIHNTMIRALNSIYLQAPNITSLKDKADFIIFCQVFIEELHGHHHLEETFLFPRIEEYIGIPGAMQGNVDQHHAFEAGVEEFKKYAYSVTPEDFDARRLIELVDKFQAVLIKHLEEEIPTLLELDRYGAHHVARAMGELDAVVLELIDDKSRVIPFVLTAHDKTFDGGIHKDLPLPWFLPYLVDWVYARKYRGTWRFSPCDMYGKPKPLPFAKEM